jgi:hypothetical protein
VGVVAACGAAVTRCMSPSDCPSLSNMSVADLWTLFTAQLSVLDLPKKQIARGF